MYCSDLQEQKIENIPPPFKLQSDTFDAVQNSSAVGGSHTEKKRRRTWNTPTVHRRHKHASVSFDLSGSLWRSKAQWWRGRGEWGSDKRFSVGNSLDPRARCADEMLPSSCSSQNCQRSAATSVSHRACERRSLQSCFTGSNPCNNLRFSNIGTGLSILFFMWCQTMAFSSAPSLALFLKNIHFALTVKLVTGAAALWDP